MTINNQFDDADTHGATSDGATPVGIRGPSGRRPRGGNSLSVPQGWTEGRPQGRPARRWAGCRCRTSTPAAEATSQTRVGAGCRRGNRRRRLMTAASVTPAPTTAFYDAPPSGG